MQDLVDRGNPQRWSLAREVFMPLMPSKRQRLTERTDDWQKLTRKQKFVKIFRKYSHIFLT
jgi:hypothetical protein